MSYKLISHSFSYPQSQTHKNIISEITRKNQSVRKNTIFEIKEIKISKVTCLNYLISLYLGLSLLLI